MPKPNTPEKIRLTKKLALKIQKVRDKQDISQEELAVRAKLNPAYISHLERGVYSPTLYVAWKIARALNIKLSDLVRDL